MSNLLKNLLFALGLAVLLWAGYVFFMRDSETSGVGAEVQVGVSENVVREAQEFKNRLAELETMKIDSTVMSDVRFVSLVNFRQAIPDEPMGRSNPFAPLE